MLLPLTPSLSLLPQAVVVGHRGAGDMFGETSLLKASMATASIVTDSDEAIVVCIEGAYLDGLFKSHPALPGRFFAFLAGYRVIIPPPSCGSPLSPSGSPFPS